MRKLQQITLFHWEENPLTMILAIAIVLRLISVFFSNGFGMHDDHFIVIEAAQSWVDGCDYNNWLPWTQGNAGPSGHSFFYVGVHYVVFYLMKIIGITNPDTRMFVIRFLHAMFSLLSVYFSYKITLRLSNKKTAAMVGLLMAACWFQPWLSVRNLVEVVCIPFLMMGTWMLLKAEGAKRIGAYLFFAGMVTGMAISIRFQSLFFVGGMGLTLLLQKKWKQTLYFGLGVIAIFIIIQAPVDYFLWGKPFAELMEYVRYNFANKYEYFVSPWYTYIFTICGFLIPPISIFIFWGYLKSFRKHLLLFLPTFVFLLLHSYFPNKQERFIFPILPFIIMGGIMAFSEVQYKKRLAKFIKGSWIFFWVINIILLAALSVYYGKKSRVESMLYLYKYQHIGQILIEDSNKESTTMPPLFYIGEWPVAYTTNAMNRFVPVVNPFPADQQPSFVFFYDDANLAKRLGRIKTIFPNLSFETSFKPGFIDQILHTMNPMNKIETIYLFRNNDAKVSLRN